MNIDLENLTKCFTVPDGTITTVLNNLNFSDDITTLAVIGPSGGGKSTLIRIMAGLLKATSGTVRIGTENKSPQTGFVFQQNGLFKHWSGFENITIPLEKVHGYSPEQAAARAAELLDRFDLLNDAEKLPINLSGGQQQRIAIARAVAPKPELLFLDEPTSALDPEYTVEVLDMIDELKKNDGLNFIVVTHHMGFARRACEKTLYLSGGHITEYGNSETLFSHPQTPELQRFFAKILEW